MAEAVSIEPSRRTSVKQVTIPSGGSLSTVLTTDGYALKAIVFPAAFTDPTVLSFQASDQENGTYVDLYDSGGGELQITFPGVNRAAALSSNQRQVLAPFLFVKIRAGGGAAPVVQAAERILTCILGLSLE